METLVIRLERDGIAEKALVELQAKCLLTILNCESITERKGNPKKIAASLKSIAGLWADYELDTNKIREKSWKRTE